MAIFKKATGLGLTELMVNRLIHRVDELERLVSSLRTVSLPIDGFDLPPQDVRTEQIVAKLAAIHGLTFRPAKVDPLDGYLVSEDK